MKKGSRLCFVVIISLVFINACSSKHEKKNSELINKLEQIPAEKQSTYIDSLADAIQKISSPDEYSSFLSFIEYLNQKTESPELQISQLYFQGELFRLLGETDKALDILYQSIPIFPASKHETTKIKILNLIGYLHYQRGQENKSFQDFVLDLKKVNPEKAHQQGWLTYYLAEYFKSKGDYSKALEYCEKLFTIYEILKDTTGLAIACEQKAEILMLMHDYPKSIEEYYRTLTHQRKLARPDTSKVYIQFAENYLKLNQYQKAIDHLTPLLKQSLDDTHFFSQVNYTLGLAYLGQKEINQSETFFHKNYQLLDINPNPINFNSAFEYGKIQKLKGNYRKAEEVFRKITELSDSNYNIAAEAMYELASIYQKKQNFSQANEYLLKHIELLKIIKQREDRNLITELEAQNQLSLKEQRISLLYKDTEIKKLQYSKQQTINRLLISGISLLFILLGLITYLFISGIRKNRLLKLQNLEINEKNEELRQINDELQLINQLLLKSEEKLKTEIETQDKLMSIIAHDLKSPLISLKHLLSIYQLKEKVNDGFERNQIVERINLELSNLLELLDNLLTWAINHREKTETTLDTLNISQIVEQTTNLFIEQAKLKRIKITKAIHPDLTSPCDKNMLEFIVRNFISNAIKFTPEKGEIFVMVKQETANIAIRVKDTGIGLSQEQLAAITTAQKTKPEPGTLGERGAGIALSLCYEFANKLKANITIESQKNIGSTFSLLLPR
ncbi:MAG TPA: ATP-binding protein [Salinivirgaceae bacterium]|nr:ATP-binding protein [Salinivirgaceae bacterium]